MRTNKFSIGAAVLAAGFTACTSDAPVVTDVNQTVDSDQTRYLAVEITAPKADLTKAFEDGTPNESYVSRLDFIFYDANGQPTGNVYSIDTDNDPDANFEDFGTGVDNVTRIWTSVVPVELVQGQNLPSQVICIINSTYDVITQVANQPLSELRNRDVDYFSHDGETFLMSNSVYYGTNVLTGQVNVRICATPINPNSQLYDSEQEAEDAIKNATDADQSALVNIYVERVAAKAGLSMDASAVEDYELKDKEGNKVVLKFVPEYWFLNATDNNTYVVKRYATYTDETIDQTYDQINGVLTGDDSALNFWNDETNHRSYWGVGPAYFKDDYPYTADDITDSNATYPVTYYSYNQVVTEAAKGDDVSKQAIAAVNGSFSTSNTGNVASGYLYGRESTVNIYTIRDVENDNPVAAVASAVLIGTYKATVNGEESSQTFYIEPFTNENKGIYYATADDVKSTMLTRQRTIFVDAAGTTPWGDSPETENYDLVEVAHPSAAARAAMASLGMNSYLSARIVTIQLKQAPTSGGLYFYNTTTNKIEAITAENLDLVNAQLVQTAGTFNIYYNGRAFFNIPIRHLGWTGDNYKDGVYDWEHMKIGELGFVRNHVYNMTIDKISGLGNGVGDDDQPIVPSKDDMTQYVAMRLNILSWNVVSSWSVSF